MKRFLLLVAFSLALACSASATVIIYKGTGVRVKGDGVTATRTACVVYFVVDPDTLHGNLIIAEPKNKIVFDNGSRNYGITEINTKPKLTTYLTVGGGSYADARNFQNFYLHFHGIRTNLQASDTNPVIVQLPRVITGFHSDNLSSKNNNVVSAFAWVASYHLEFAERRTQTSNNGGQTVAQTSFDIRQGLVHGGYTDTSP